MGNGSVVYRGAHTGPAGASVVWLEAADGTVLGALRHVVRHSPTGFSWGYSGSGPADLARSLLVDALGADARCSTCAGTGTVVCTEEGQERPFEPAGDDAEEAFECLDCSRGDGIRFLPYQDFKREVVAGLSDEWRLERAAVRAWAAARGLVPPAEELT